MIDCKPRTYSGNCAGRTAASSMNATGFAGPMHPVKSDRPDLRTDQTMFICAGLVRIFVRSPIFLDCKIDNRSVTLEPRSDGFPAVMFRPRKLSGSFLDTAS